MMKFYFITPENRENHRDEMRSYFQKMAIVCGEFSLDSYDTQSASYVVCTHSLYGVIGGLRLLPTLGPKLTDDSLNNTGIELQDEETWELSKLFFYLPPEDEFEKKPEKFDHICMEFYTTLWDYLQKISNASMLVTILPEEEHEDASFFGSWPFVLESPISNPFKPEAEEYILGVLKLNEEKEELALAG